MCSTFLNMSNVLDYENVYLVYEFVERSIRTQRVRRLGAAPNSFFILKLKQGRFTVIFLKFKIEKITCGGVLSFLGCTVYENMSINILLNSHRGVM